MQTFGHTTNTQPVARPLVAKVLDEAFADLPDIATRIDAAEPTVLAGKYVAETDRLVTKIGEQMKSLHQQQARLARLLRDLNVTCDR